MTGLHLLASFSRCFFPIWLLAVSAIGNAQQSAPPAPETGLSVTLKGAISKQGSYTLPPGAKLFEAVSFAGVSDDAYLPGAAWLNLPARRHQEKLKLGILFDLANFIAQDQEENIAFRQTLLLRLEAQVKALPVTGRRQISLDPVRLELERAKNRPLAQGDTLIFPLRPNLIQISGAVLKDCHLPFVGLKPAADYIADCPLHPAADTDWLYLIQPDGQLILHAAGAWNNQGPAYLAPGARIFVPLNNTARRDFSTLNRELASFLATQLPFAEAEAP